MHSMYNERGSRRDKKISILHTALSKYFDTKDERYYDIAEYLGERGASINTVSHYLFQYDTEEFAALSKEEQIKAAKADPRGPDFMCSFDYIKVEVLPIDVAISYQRFDFVRKALEKWNSKFPIRPAHAFVQAVVEWGKETDYLSLDAIYCILSFLGGRIDPYKFSKGLSGYDDDS